MSITEADGSKKVIIPSMYFSDAETMINRLKPYFFDTEEYYFKIVEDGDTSNCFNLGIFGLEFVTSATLLASALIVLN